MSDNYAGLTALQENVIKTKEHVESVRSALDTAKQNVFQYTTMVSPSADQLNRVVQFVGNTDSTYTHGYFYTCESDGSGGYQWTEIEFGSIGDFLEEVVELPTATASNVGHTYILIAPQTGYKLGGIYQNHSDGETPPTYSWVLISSSNLTSGNAIDIINDQINVKVDDDTIHIDSTSNEAYVDNAIRKQFIGTQAQWDALSSTEQAEYAIVDITDNIDYTGNIDAVPTQNSPNAVASGGVYSAIENLNTAKQNKTLETSITIGGVSQTTVEGALDGLNGLVPSDASASNKFVTKNNIFFIGDRRDILGWADLSNSVTIDGSSNYANNIGRIEGHNAIIQVRNPSIGYQWPVTNSGDSNKFIDFGSSMQFFIDRVNNRLYVRYSDSTDMSSWGKIVTESDFNYKSGTVNFNCGANQWTTVDITFDSPMPDADYVVTLESGNTAYVHVQNVTTKTANGFIIIVWNRDELAGDRQGIINWQAYKIPH